MESVASKTAQASAATRTEPTGDPMGTKVETETVAIRRRGWVVRRALLAADVAGLTAAFALAEFLVPAGSSQIDQAGEIGIFVATVPLCVVMGKVYGLYDHDEERTDHSTVDDFNGIFPLVTIGAWILLVGCWITRIATPDLRKLVLFWVAAITLVVASRAIARTLSRRSKAYVQNAIIIGAGDVGQLIARKLLQHPEYRINLLGFIDDEPKDRREDIEDLTILGPIERLAETVQSARVDRVFIAFNNDSDDRVLALVRPLRTRACRLMWYRGCST